MILRNVFAMPREAAVIFDSYLGEPPLPDLSQVPGFPLQAKGESSLDELHRFLDGRVATYCNQQMHVVGHDYEVMQPEFPAAT